MEKMLCNKMFRLSLRYLVRRTRCLMFLSEFFFSDFFFLFFLFRQLPAWINLSLAVANFHGWLSYWEYDFPRS